MNITMMMNHKTERKCLTKLKEWAITRRTMSKMMLWLLMRKEVLVTTEK